MLQLIPILLNLNCSHVLRFFYIYLLTTYFVIQEIMGLMGMPKGEAQIDQTSNFWLRKNLLFYRTGVAFVTRYTSLMLKFQYKCWNFQQGGNKVYLQTRFSCYVGKKWIMIENWDQICLTARLFKIGHMLASEVPWWLSINDVTSFFITFAFGFLINIHLHNQLIIITWKEHKHIYLISQH